MKTRFKTGDVVYWITEPHNSEYYLVPGVLTDYDIGLGWVAVFYDFDERAHFEDWEIELVEVYNSPLYKALR